MSNKNFEATVLDLLNRGAVKELLIERGCRYLEVCREEQVASIDVTGDDVPELIIGGGFPLGNVFVFGCKDGQYVMLLKEKASFDKTPEIIEIADINANGMNDIVVKQITCHVCVGVKVFEWNTEQFSSLVWAELYPGSGEYQDMAEIDGYATVYIEDRDGDGIKEIVLEGGIPSWPGGMWGMDGPYRSKKIVYTWNGENYVFVVQEYEPPRFRFEAVQDGDTASERDDYEKALAFYQAVIYSDTLKSWTYDEWYGTFTDAEYECCSTPDINEMPYNETEYFQLATYSRYRIMVLYVLMGRESDAQTIYKSLLSEVSSDSAGYPYVQLATEFWEEYQESREVLKACEKAIVFAEQNDEILIPLGNNHGMFSKYYKPETICPFK
jgi:tetratricopeptide (TPR) repeat protein